MAPRGRKSKKDELKVVDEVVDTKIEETVEETKVEEIVEETKVEEVVEETKVEEVVEEAPKGELKVIKLNRKTATLENGEVIRLKSRKEHKEFLIKLKNQ